MKETRPVLQKRLVKDLVGPAKKHLSLPDYSRALGAPKEAVMTELNAATGTFQTVAAEKAKPVTVDLKPLMEYGILETCDAEVAELRNLYLQQSMKLGQGLEEIGQVTLYNLDIAEDAIEKEEYDLAAAAKMSLEGFERAVNRAEAAKTTLENLRKAMDEGVAQEAKTLIGATLELAHPKTIADWTTQVRRKELVAKGSNLQTGTTGLIQRAGKKADQGLREGLAKLKALYIRIRTQLGLSEPPPVIQTEISDFLAESASAIRSLPFVYQRLFADEPVKDEVFFESREKELQRLQTALENFKKGRFAPAVIIGEPEGGKTSLINIFLETQKSKPRVVHIDATEISRSAGGFLNGVVDTFKWKMEIPDLEEIAGRLNGFRRPRIIVVDPLDQLFSKSVGGFSNLLDFSRLVSLTSRNVF